LQRLEREFVGQVLEIELERKESQVVYEITMMSPAGYLIEIVYDGKTGALVSATGERLHDARRQASPWWRDHP
jgi:uncharacterized membrane protein YkoI